MKKTIRRLLGGTPTSKRQPRLTPDEERIKRVEHHIQRIGRRNPRVSKLNRMIKDRRRRSYGQR